MLARVAAIFLAICPDLPMPITTVLPEQLIINSHASSNSSPILFDKASIARFSISIVRSADFIGEIFEFMVLVYHLKIVYH